MFNNLVVRNFFSRNKRFIGGNWKSNNTLVQTKDIVANILNKLEYSAANVDVIVAPVALHIPAVKQGLTQKNVQVASQNCSNHPFGAFTGEISAKHVKDFGLEWTILGHSERRTLFGERDDGIVSKTKIALENGLKVIYCFGETLTERKAEQTWNVLESQLVPLFNAFPGDSAVWQNDIVLAYEPVWAIGTGISSSPQQTEEVFTWLRSRIAKHVKNANSVRIIYGGSANKANSADYLAIKSLDGLLVGGASLKPEFADMVKICDQAK